MRNFECGLSSKLAADVDDCDAFDGNDELTVDAGGVGLFERRLCGRPLPLLLVVDDTLFGEWACDGGV